MRRVVDFAPYRGCRTNPQRGRWIVRKGGFRKSAIASVARGASVPTSSDADALAAISAITQQLFRDGFMRQPPSFRASRACPADARNNAKAEARDMEDSNWL